MKETDDISERAPMLQLFVAGVIHGTVIEQIYSIS